MSGAQNEVELFFKQSTLQKLSLRKNIYTGVISLVLNNVLQFTSTEYFASHMLLVTIPLCFVPVIRHVLILGGGDGFAVQQLVQNEQVIQQIQSITLCEIDIEMINMSKTVKEMLELNNNCFSHPKVNIHITDAIGYVIDMAADNSNHAKFDLIIGDCDTGATLQPTPLTLERGIKFMSAITKLLSTNGIYSVIIPSEDSSKEAISLQELIGNATFTTFFKSYFESTQTLHFRGPVGNEIYFYCSKNNAMENVCWKIPERWKKRIQPSECVDPLTSSIFDTLYFSSVEEDQELAQHEDIK